MEKKQSSTSGNPVKLIWITENAEQIIAQCARVSSSNPDNPDIEKLLRYMIRNAHWSPFEMAHACVEINCSRAVGRQLLRHRSFGFQEFSQRYADPVELLQEQIVQEARLQDRSNRQSSIPINPDSTLATQFVQDQCDHWSGAIELYKRALAAGIAKECARVFLPEHMTPSRMYMVGSIRSWLHYLEVRLGNGTQKEHQRIAEEIYSILTERCPTIFKAFFGIAARGL